MKNKLITVNSLKYDLRIRKSWTCRLIEQNASLLVLSGEFDEDIAHPGLGSIARGTKSQEFYWLDRWYNIFRFSEPDGKFRNFYCNIAMPPRFTGNTLDYVDLDIDVIVWPDGKTETLDEDDFIANASAFSYPTDVRTNALSSLAELNNVIVSRKFPFNEL